MNKKRNSPDFEELEELLWRVEQALEDPEEELDLEDYAPADLDDEEPEVFRNYANSYGNQDDHQTSGENYDNDTYYNENYYPAPNRRGEPVLDRNRWERNMYRREMVEDTPVKKPRKKRRGCGCGCLTVLMVPVLLVALAAGAIGLLIQPPRSDVSLGTRKQDTATILLCGTDRDGTRTDTIMLLYLSGSEGRISLTSLPRDSYTVTSSGKAAKLNSAYGRGGTGEAGMKVLMDYVQDIIGYRPDGYVLLNFDLVPRIADLMGGLDYEVPMDMELDNIRLEEGYQHLNGEELLTLLRFRKGYAAADLKRIEVQRSVLKACISQWLVPENISSALEAISLVESGSISSLDLGDYLWLGKTLLMNMDSIDSSTLPGYADYIGGASYYILDPGGIAELVNGTCNPYRQPVTAEDLNIAG